MTAEALKVRLGTAKHAKAEADALVGELMDFPGGVAILLEVVRTEDRGERFLASWTLDNLLRKKLNLILPHIEEFTLLLPQLKNESCIRSLAHSCELLCTAHFKRGEVRYREGIDRAQWERIMTVCLDWLIAPMAMAPKVFAMTSLFYLGFEFPWVHPELRAILEENYATGGSGYRNRAKKTLDMLARLGH